MEKKERRERRTNIIVKGMEGNGNPKEEVTKLFREKLKIEGGILTVSKIGKEQKNNNGLLMVRMENLEAKKGVMKKKGLLKDTKIFIYDDLTWTESRIQNKIRIKAKKEKETGNRIRLDYQKLEINEKWFRWLESRDELEKINFRNERGENRRKTNGKY